VPEILPRANAKWTQAIFSLVYQSSVASFGTHVFLNLGPTQVTVKMPRPRMQHLLCVHVFYNGPNLGVVFSLQ